MRQDQDCAPGSCNRIALPLFQYRALPPSANQSAPGIREFLDAKRLTRLCPRWDSRKGVALKAAAGNRRLANQNFPTFVYFPPLVGRRETSIDNKRHHWR